MLLRLEAPGWWYGCRAHGCDEVGGPVKVDKVPGSGDPHGADIRSAPRDTVVQASHPRGALLAKDPGQRDRKAGDRAKPDVLMHDPEGVRIPFRQHWLGVGLQVAADVLRGEIVAVASGAQSGAESVEDPAASSRRPRSWVSLSCSAVPSTCRSACRMP